MLIGAFFKPRAVCEPGVPQPSQGAPIARRRGNSAGREKKTGAIPTMLADDTHQRPLRALVGLPPRNKGTIISHRIQNSVANKARCGTQRRHNEDAHLKMPRRRKNNLHRTRQLAHLKTKVTTGTRETIRNGNRRHFWLGGMEVASENEGDARRKAVLFNNKEARLPYRLSSRYFLSSFKRATENTEDTEKGEKFHGKIPFSLPRARPLRSGRAYKISSLIRRASHCVCCWFCCLFPLLLLVTNVPFFYTAHYKQQVFL